MEGKEVARFTLQEGRHTEVVDIRFVQNGIYLYQLTVDGIPRDHGRFVITD